MTTNFFENIPNEFPEEIIEEILNTDNIRIERIISDGQTSPDEFWYEQKENEWLIILEGDAILEYQDSQEKKLKKGDYVYIPAMQKHRVKEISQTQKTIWLAVFF